MERLNTLRDLFEAELNVAYSAGHQMIEALPRMIEAASSEELREGFREDLAESQRQASRLEEIFEMLDMEPEEEECEGMAGIVEDGEKMVKAQGEPHVKDAALIAAAQKAEHWEIATYGTLRAFARTLGEDEVAEKLAETSRAVSRTDELLTSVAMKGPNVQSPRS